MKNRIAEGYIPRGSHGPEPAMLSHECVCILNASNTDSDVSLFYADRDPVTYWLKVPAQRTRHIRFNDLTEPARIPLETEFSTVLESNVPVVCQHTRLDSRQAENALLTTIAYPGDE